MRYTVLRATPEKKQSNRIRPSYGYLVKVDATWADFSASSFHPPVLSHIRGGSCHLDYSRASF